MNDIITREQAYKMNRKRFFTGKACKHGHVAERFVTTGGCVKCNAIRSKMFQQGTTVGANAKARGWFTYPLHPDDFAKVLGICQGLDMARGRVPFIPGSGAAPVSEYTEAMRRDVLAQREAIINKTLPQSTYSDDDLSPEEMSR